MTDDDGSGCIVSILASVALVGVVLVALALTGLPNVADGALSWDIAATVERQETERLRIEREAQTDQIRIVANAESSRAWALALVLIAACASSAAVGVAWTMRPHRPPPIVTALLAYYPGHAAELIEGEWCISNADGEYLTLTDAIRLAKDA